MRTLIALVVAALLFVGLTGSAQTPALDFGSLEKIAAEELRNTGTPGGAIAVVLGDRVVYTRAFGIANVETNEPVRPEMLFRLGSTTKMFTAAALVSLAERGAIDLAVPVGSYVSGLDAKVGRVTADQLLSHQSGFFDEAPMFGSHDETALEKEVRSWTDSRFFTEPGKIFSYSNPGYWFAGFLIEHASRRNYADQLAESIFAPLGMKRTTLRPLEAMTYPIAQGHEETPQGPRVIRPAANNAASWPAGSIFSNVEDLSRFVIAFVNDGRLDGKQVLPPAVIRALSTPRAKIPGGDGSYGYGLQIAKYRGVDLVSHGGSRAGYGSSIRMVPSKKFGVIAVANRTGIGLNATAVRAMEIALPLEPSTKSTTAQSAIAPADMHAYVGTYSQGARTMDVLIRDGKLMLKQNNRETPLMKFSETEIATESGARWVVVRNTNGAVEYLHAGSRSWRKVK
ncbi:MAG TPA: serine hydrolase domain-containing protein [Vicinamibacterales bacterium]|nr:serine hydrolase domain-containing protein [Vicinamibacterales bacterium]